MSEIQAVLFDRKIYNPAKARYWLKKNDMKAIKRVHVTKNKLRYRLNPPENYTRFATKNASKEGHVKFIFGFK